MIRTETEYREAIARLREERAGIEKHQSDLKSRGFSGEELKRLTDPLMSFHIQLQEEVETYERLKRKDIPTLTNFRGIGDLLIGLRIASGMSQQKLAEKLDVDASQVSRDERNEYHGITIERAARIMEALGAKIEIICQIEDACASA